MAEEIGVAIRSQERPKVLHARLLRPRQAGAKPHLPDAIYCHSAYEAAAGVDAVVIATEWEQFRALDLARLKSAMTRPVIVDLRNVYRSDEMRRASFRYLGVGRAEVK